MVGGSLCHHRENVSRRVLPTPVVFLLSGILLRLTATNAGCMTGIVDTLHVLVSHSLKSWDSVIKNQVRDVVTCCLCLRPLIGVSEVLRFAAVVSSSFFTMRNFWDSSADCRQTFPRVRKWVYLRNWVRNLETYQPSLGAQNMKIRTRFWTTSRLGGE